LILTKSDFRIAWWGLIIFILSGCGPKPSPLIISDYDRYMFRSILKRETPEVRFFDAYDSTPIACTIVKPQTDPLGIVLVIHGIGVRAKAYLSLADSLAQEGYITYLMDIRGHGHSGGESGDAPADSSLLKDARDFYQFTIGRESRDLPVVAVGHSLGTYIWTATLSVFNEVRVDGLILIAGGIQQDKKVKDRSPTPDTDFIYLHKLELLASFILPGMKPVEVVLPDEPMSEGQGLVSRYSLNFFKSLDIGDDYLSMFYKKYGGPILLISGELDEVMPADRVRDTFKMSESHDKTLVMKDDATHTSIIWDGTPDIVTWLDDRFGLE